jgi:hypothetical protein
LVVHAVTVVGFGCWLCCVCGSAEDRRTSNLAPLVLAYKDSHWWWFIATMLHLDMATVTLVLVADPVAGKVMQIVLALLMFLVTIKVNPFDNKPVLLELMGKSLLTQVAVCVSGLTMLLTKNAAIHVLVDVTLGVLLLAVTGRFLWVLRQDIADIRRSAAKACHAWCWCCWCWCWCWCCCCRAKQGGSEKPGVREEGLEEVDDIGEGEKGVKTAKSKKKARSSREERRGMKRGGGKAVSTRTSRTVV